MLNSAIIMGRLTADPELRKTPSGVAVTRFTVAVDRNFAKEGEERKADFINVLCWRSTAEFVCKYFNKGSMIAVQGSIQTGSYEKDGVKRSTFEVVADNVSFCGGKNDKQGSTEKTEYKPRLDIPADVDDDDLPF